MTFLPIVERELRVASRKRSTGWLRVAAGLVALTVGSGCLTLSIVARSGTASFGGILFGILTWMSLAATLCAGLFFTADCLSEEKREGTLGFLFLTDLRGYDVVLGKLLATSLRAFYGLLAVLPIVGVTLLMGGVTGGQFGKTALALVHALWFSLAAGLLVSSISRDSQKALAGTFLLLLLLNAGGPVADWVQSTLARRPFQPCFSLTSPVYVFMAAAAWGRTSYWLGLGLSQALSWLLLMLGCYLIRHTWQESARKSDRSPRAANYAWKYGGPKRRARLRQQLLEINPVLWLSCREQWQALALWGLVLVVMVAGLAVLVTDSSPVAWIGLNSLSGVLSLALYLWIASQACRFFIETRRTGLIELLLATPLDARQIVRGQWRALVRLFGLPALLLLGSQILVACLVQHFSWGRAAAGTGLEGVMSVATAIFSGVAGIANLIALGWFGMWMGMTSKNTGLASLKAIVFVQVIPWMVIGFLSSMLVMAVMVPTFLKSGAGSVSTTVTKGGATVKTTAAVAGMAAWFPLLIAGVAALLSAAKDLGFILWARKRLYGRFREQASQSGSYAVVAAVPMILVAPPVIGAPPAAAGSFTPSKP